MKKCVNTAEFTKEQITERLHEAVEKVQFGGALRANLHNVVITKCWYNHHLTNLAIMSELCNILEEQERTGEKMKTVIKKHIKHLEREIEDEKMDHRS